MMKIRNKKVVKSNNDSGSVTSVCSASDSDSVNERKNENETETIEFSECASVQSDDSSEGTKRKKPGRPKGSKDKNPRKNNQKHVKRGNKHRSISKSPIKKISIRREKEGQLTKKKSDLSEKVVQKNLELPKPPFQSSSNSKNFLIKETLFNAYKLGILQEFFHKR